MTPESARPAGLIEWLGQLGRVTSLDVVREGATARVWRSVVDGAGTVYVKAVATTFGHEVRLTEKLGLLLPGAVPRLLLADAERGWMAMPDAGPTLRTRTEEGASIANWTAAVIEFARLQRKATSHVPALLAAGAPDRRAHTWVQALERAIERRALFQIDNGSEDAIDEAGWQRIVASRALVETLVETLADSGIPETIHHDDFHANNVCFADGNFVFFDWAESAISHPFLSPPLMLRYARYLFDAAPSVLDEMRDAYLSEWSDYGDERSRLLWFDAAGRLTRLSRALTWLDIAEQSPLAAHRKEGAGSATYWMHSFATGGD